MTRVGPQIGVGVVCLRGDEALIIKRGKPPFLGEWSIPGGGLELGETTRQAALRELREETAVEAELIGLIDVIDSIASDENGRLAHHLVIVDFAAVWRAGDPEAGDDALEARFAPREEALRAVSWRETRRVIEAAFAMAR